jgi:hypothetical protein
LHDFAGLGVKGRERLVHNQDFGIDGKSASEIAPLLHTAGEFVRVMVFKPLQTDQFDKFASAFLAFPVIQTLAFEAKNHVFGNRAPGHQARILENHAAVYAWTRNWFAIDNDFASRRLQQAVAQINKGGFAASARTDDRHKLTVMNLKVYLVQRQKPTAGSRLIVFVPQSDRL